MLTLFNKILSLIASLVMSVPVEDNRCFNDSKDSNLDAKAALIEADCPVPNPLDGFEAPGSPTYYVVPPATETMMFRRVEK